MHYFHNRQIRPLKRFLVSTHRLRCPARPRPPPSLHLVQTQALTPLEIPPSPHRLYDLQDTLNELMHFLPVRSDFSLLKNGFYTPHKEKKKSPPTKGAQNKKNRRLRTKTTVRPSSGGGEGTKTASPPHYSTEFYILYNKGAGGVL